MKSGENTIWKVPITLQDMLQLESIFMTEEVPAVPADLESLLMKARHGGIGKSEKNAGSRRSGTCLWT